MPTSVDTRLPLSFPPPPEQGEASTPATRPLSRPNSFERGRVTSMGRELRRCVSSLPPRSSLPDRLPYPPEATATASAPTLHVGRPALDPDRALAMIGTAASFSGMVEMKQGRLTSRQPVLDALLRLAGRELAGVTLAGPTSLTFTLDPRARDVHDVLQLICTVDKVEGVPGDRTPLLADGEQAIEGNVLIPLLQAVIMKGRDALGAAAGVQVNGAHWNLRDYLASCKPSVASDDDALAGIFEAKFEADPDLRARLCAASALQIATKKNFALGGLMGSLAVSSGLGTAWELGLAPAIKSLGQKLLEQAGMPSPTRALLTAAMGTGVDSIPPVVIESMDTLCVLAILKTMKGDDDWTLKSLVPNALKAGAISSALSIPNNLMQYLSTGSRTADLAVGALTTEAAIFGAASGVPMEIQENKDNMHAALVQSHRDGLFAPVPQDTDPRQYVAEMAQRALDVDPSTSLAQKSMAVAATVGMLPLILGDKALNLVPESVLRIVRSTVFNPIEAIALNALVLGARAKLPGVFTSDHDKHAGLIQRILQRAGDTPDGDRPIQARELDQIFNPPQEVLGRTGTAISSAINAMVSAPAKGAQWLAMKIGVTSDNRSQEQRLPYESLHQPDGAEAV